MNFTLSIIGLIWIIILTYRFIIWFSKLFKDTEKDNSGDYFVDQNTAILSYEKDTLKEVIYGPKFIKMNHARMRSFNLSLIYVSLSSYKYKCLDKNRIALDVRFCLEFADFDNITKYNNYSYSQYIKDSIQQPCCDEFQKIFASYTKEGLLENIEIVKEEIKNTCDPIIYDLLGYKIQKISLFELR
jgi:hypothetical protein